LGDAHGAFKTLPFPQGNLFVDGEVRKIEAINIAGNLKPSFLFAINNETLKLISK